MEVDPVEVDPVEVDPVEVDPVSFMAHLIWEDLQQLNAQPRLLASQLATSSTVDVTTFKKLGSGDISANLAKALDPLSLWSLMRVGNVTPIAYLRLAP